MFDATASKYSRIQFDRIDIDTHDPLVERYNVNSYPRVVFLDGGGKVLYNGRAWSSPDDFGELIK